MDFFGFSIVKKNIQDEKKDVTTFAPVDRDDGAVTVSAGGAWGTYLDLEGAAKTEAELVTKYREMALQPECETAIDEIINEAISKEDNQSIVNLNMDELDAVLPDSVKKVIHEEWVSIQEMLNFNNFGYEMFRRWYTDGRIYYHIMIDTNNPRDGIKEFRYIDPRKIRKVRSVHKEKRGTATITVTDEEFFIYNEKGFKNTAGTSSGDNQGLKITTDSIIHVTSGLMDKEGKLVLSYLHKAVKPLNQVRMLEDATVIYRISRAPERRIFYIDVGNLPKMKAEEYVKDMMTKHKNRLVYDATTGEVRDDRKFMTMLEDYWLPRRDGSKGTEISTLPAGQNLGQMEDVFYFEKKLYKALNVPVGRLNGEESGGFNVGRSSEISRDELKFQKFINRLRTKFSDFLLQALKKQLVLKGIFNTEEWDAISSKIFFEFAKDNYFAELKDAEILRERLTTLQLMDPYVGKYYSTNWVRKNILKQTDEDIEEINKDNDQEQKEFASAGLAPDGVTPLDQMMGAGGPPAQDGGGQPQQNQGPTPEPKKEETKPAPKKISTDRIKRAVKKKPKKKEEPDRNLKNKGSYKYSTVQGSTKPYNRRIFKK